MNMNMKTKMARSVLLCLMLCVAGWISTVAQAKEKAKEEAKEVSITWKQLPAAVQKAMAKQSKNVEEIVKETEEGETVYEIEIKVDGKETEYTYSSKGKLLETKEEIDLKKAPVAVQKMLTALAFGGKLEEVAKETEAGKIAYEAEIERDGLLLEVKLDPKGNLLEIEIANSKDNDDDEDEDDNEDNNNDKGSKKKEMKASSKEGTRELKQNNKDDDEDEGDSNDEDEDEDDDTM